jgi:nitrilase
MTHPKAAVIQMNSGTEPAKNLQAAAALIEKAAREAQLIVLPENFALMGVAPDQALATVKTLDTDAIQAFLSDQARTHKVWLVGGTIPLLSADKTRARAACLVYDDTGKEVARYDKIHLFDVCITESKEEYRESAVIEPGETLTVVDTPIGKLGLAVCYDARFPLLFQALVDQGMEVLALPSAFTQATGQAHWDVLTRARCIETQCYGLFANQTGNHNARKTYGHSMIVNPWGDALNSLTDEVGFVTATIDLHFLKQVRKNLPALTHRRGFPTSAV